MHTLHFILAFWCSVITEKPDETNNTTANIWNLKAMANAGPLEKQNQKTKVAEFLTNTTV